MFLTVLAIIIGLSLTVGIERGLVKWDKPAYSCQFGRGWYNEVDKQLWMNIGRLRLYYQPVTWGCIKDERYDPTQNRVENGQLVPK